MDTRTRRPLRYRREHHSQCHPNALIGCLSFTVGLISAVPHINQLLLERTDVATQQTALFADVTTLQHHHAMLKTLPCIPSFFGMLTGYSLALLVGGSACFTACCAGQCGLLALQAAILDVMIVHPLNFALWLLYWVLTPLRYVWRHFLTWLVVPFVSIFHMRPSFFDAGLDKFVLAVPFCFRDVGMGDIYDSTEKRVRMKMRHIFEKLIPRLSVPDAILTNTLFRLMLGFAMFPLAWWLCDEMYCVPLSKVEETNAMTGEERLDEGLTGEDEPDHEEEVPSSANESSNKALDVTFVFPKCRFLVEARKTYGDRAQGNKVCRRVCRLMVEELSGRLMNHPIEVRPNLKTLRCTFTVSTKTFDGNNNKPTHKDVEARGGCACEDKSLEW